MAADSSIFWAAKLRRSESPTAARLASNCARLHRPPRVRPVANSHSSLDFAPFQGEVCSGVLAEAAPLKLGLIGNSHQAAGVRQRTAKPQS